jgi:hypothetical protein
MGILEDALMGKIKELLEPLEPECEFGCEPDDFGFTQCEVCHHTSHSCAGCLNDYCECSEQEWAVGKDGITYCSQECADEYGGGD